MPFIIVRQDITKIKADAIVNAANTDLREGGGVCGAIFRAAGADLLRGACEALAPIQPGEAVITPGFGLRAKYIIHAAGPVYQKSHREQSEQLLRAAYASALKRAVEHRCESVAFPLISSGIYGYPKDEALRVASSAIQGFLDDHEMSVTLAVFDQTAFTLSRELQGAVESYIDENYVLARQDRHRRLRGEQSESLYDEHDFRPSASVKYSLRDNPPVTSAAPQALAPYEAAAESFADLLDEPFTDALFRLIDLKGMTDVEVYKRANLDRKHFSKIRAGKGYMPGRKTVIALAIALRLSPGEARDLLRQAGFALSRSQLFDVIIQYFIDNGRYDIFEINEVLFKYDQPLLGG
ncbi:MAG: macro domain-containing protein [Eubacteriales bacterium]